MNSIQSIKLMKRQIFLPAVMFATMLLAGCNESLVEMNTDPLRLSELPDEYLFTTAVRYTVGDVSNYDTTIWMPVCTCLRYKLRKQVR